MTIAITGGHITPALGFIDHCVSNHDKILFFGRTMVSESSNTLARESELLSGYPHRFFPLKECKWHRKQLLLSILRAPRCLFNIAIARQVIQDEAVDAVVCFGGYLAPPVAYAAFSLSRPVILHEQSLRRGIATSLIAPIANAIGYSFPQSLSHHPSAKSSVTGNILRPEFFKTSHSRPRWYSSSQKLPLLLITGGNQGSQMLNQLVFDSLLSLTSQFRIVHQTGRAESLGYKHACEIRQGLPDPSTYYPVEWINAQDLVWLMRHAQVHLSRAGANTITEIVHTCLPSLLIPLEQGRLQEQVANANLLTESQAGIMLRQSDATPQLVIQMLKQLSLNHDRYRHQLQKLQSLINPTAAQDLYGLLIKSLS